MAKTGIPRNAVQKGNVTHIALCAHNAQTRMGEQGSGGNVIAALASFFIPGLGQLLQGRLGPAAIHVILSIAVWAVTFGTMGWIVHLYSTYDAATWSG